MTIYEFVAARGYTLADTDKLILKRLTEVKGTDEETTVLACMWRDGRLCALWRAYREYEASQSAVQMKLFL